jgi:hypothetical protein
VRDSGGVGHIFDFIDPDGIQLEFFYLDQAKLRLSSTYSVSAETTAEPNP